MKVVPFAEVEIEMCLKADRDVEVWEWAEAPAPSNFWFDSVAAGAISEKTLRILDYCELHCMGSVIAQIRIIRRKEMTR